VNRDGIADFAASAVHSNTGQVGAGSVYVILGKPGLGSGGTLDLAQLDGTNGFGIHGARFEDALGLGLAGGSDLDGDGYDDLVLGSRLLDHGTTKDLGGAIVFFGSAGVGGTGKRLVSGLAWPEGFAVVGAAPDGWTGDALSVAGDLNADGFADLALGAPEASAVVSDGGATYVLSGDPELGTSGPIDLAALDGSLGFAVHGGTSADRVGRDVALIPDVTGDGVDDLLMGGNTSKYPGTSTKLGRAWTLFGVREAKVYCTAKLNSCGALPSIAAQGIPSATAGAGFTIIATDTKATQAGLLLYTDSGPGHGPFSGGILCIAPNPLKRSIAVVDMNGTPGQCDGALLLDMNAFAAGALGGKPLPSLTVPGTRINCQFWGRDTLANGALLSDAVEYFVGS
jgi:hypothetical protein